MITVKTLFSRFWAIAFLLLSNSFNFGYSQNIAGISPTSASIPQTLNLVITGNNTNFTAVTSFRLRHTGSATVYSATTFSTPSALSATAEFSLPPNAPLGTYSVVCFNAPDLIGAFTVNAGPGSNYGLASGKIVYDNNSNCIDDAGDTHLSGQLVTFTPGPIYTTTDANGNYSSWLPLGNYTATTSSGFCGYDITCPVGQTNAISLPTSLSTDSGNDFYISQIFNCSDVGASLSMPLLRPGFPGLIRGVVTNYGPDPASNITFTLNLPNATYLTIASVSPAPTSVSGTSYSWLIPTVAVGQTYNFNVDFNTVLLALGTVVPFSYSASPAISDPPLNNFGAYDLVVRGSFDPNDKQVWDSLGNVADGPVDPNTSLLDYLIRFQNTGNDTAFTVVIRDTIDPQLDLSSLEIIGSSHTLQFSATGQNFVAFTFPNILLVDSFANEPLSHGYVQYRINLNPGVTAPATINNSAGIFFDYNLPVATNTTSTVLCPLLSSSFTNSNAGLNYSFTGQGSSPVTQWAWDFGDGSTSTLQNPSHTYATNGQYVVCLTASNSCRSSVFCDTIYTCQFPAPSFSTSYPGSGILFSDQSHPSTTSWLWDFGDGNTSTAQSPTHNYVTPGTYYVCLTATNSCSTQTFCDSVSTCQSVNEAFNFSVLGSSVSFTDMSDLSATTWSWTFGDGGTSTLQNPVHQYGAGGTYNVCLTVSNSCESATICQTVNLCQPTNQSFSFSVQPAFLVDFVGVADPSVNAWSWDFGDGQSSTLQSPSHQYLVGGNYNVCLTVMNACSTAVTCTNLSLVRIEESWVENLSVSPNPSAGIYTVQGTTKALSDLSLRVFDVQGRVVVFGKVSPSGGKFQYTLDLEAHSSGLYLIELSDGFQKVTRKVQKL